MTERIPIQKEFGEVVRNGERLEIKKFGTNEVVGGIDFWEMDKPPHYSLDTLKIENKEERGKGFASQLLAEAERISRQTNIPIVLYDGMLLYSGDQNSNAIGMYRKRSGWTRLKDSDGETTKWYVYGSQDPKFFSQILALYNN